MAVVIELTARAITLTPGVRSGAAERCPISRENTGSSRCARSWCPDRSPELEISLRDSVTLMAFENTSKVRTTMPWTCSTRDDSVTSPPLVTARSTRTPPRNHRPSLGTRARLSDRLCKSSASAAMNKLKHIGCNVHSSCGHHRQGSTGHRGSRQGLEHARLTRRLRLVARTPTTIPHEAVALGQRAMSLQPMSTQRLGVPAAGYPSGCP